MLPEPELLSKLIGSLYDAAASPGMWEPFLEQVAKRTGATSAALMMHDASQEAHSVYCHWQLDRVGNRLYEKYFGSVDVWTQRALSKSSGDVCNSETLCSVAEFSKTEMYNDFLVHFGIEHGLFGIVNNSRPRLAVLSLYRDPSSPAFQLPAMEIVRFLVPHVQRTFDLHFEFKKLGASVAAVDSALDLLPTGVVFLGRGGKVLRMNRRASAWVAERDGLLAGREGLRAERAAESSLLEKTIREAATTLGGKGLSAGGTVMVSRRERGPLQVQISPIRGAVSAGSEAIVVVAFITDPTQRMRPPHEVLRTRYGLTPAECRVALLLVDGLAAKEIAGTVGVTVDTVRSQIRSIFGKTGVNRQSDLIRLLMGGARAVIGGI